VFKDENAGSIRLGKLDNAGTDQVRLRVVAVAEFAPEVGVI
jgi:hypothetical protein